MGKDGQNRNQNCQPRNIYYTILFCISSNEFKTTFILKEKKYLPKLVYVIYLLIPKEGEIHLNV